MVYVADEQPGIVSPRADEASDALDRLGDEIAELAAHVHAATYQLLVRLRVFDEKGGWGGGFHSCAHWLSWRTGIGLGTAREHVRVARALGELPQLSDAMRRGHLSYAKVRALTRIATLENEAQLLALARQGTASHIEKVVRAWRRVDRLEEQRQDCERHRLRDLTLYHDDDGMYVLRGRLDPEVGALLERALAAASEVLYGRREAAVSPVAAVATSDAVGAGIAGIEDGAAATTAGQRRADAIGLIAECVLRHGLEVGAWRAPASAGDDDLATVDREVHRPEEAYSTPLSTERKRSARPSCSNTVGRADRFQVVVHVDAEAFRADSDTGQSVLASGVRVPAGTSRRLACDASRVVMVHDAVGNVLGVGRRTRTVPPAIRRALDHRDKGCRFPGCGLRYCDAHHIVHWADGGTTKLDNLAMLCRRHHRAVHEEGFRVQRSESGEITFLHPDGRPFPEVPESPELPDDPVASLMTAHRASGIDIGPSTAMSWWMGQRLDLDFTLLTLRGPRPRRAGSRGYSDASDSNH